MAGEQKLWAAVLTQAIHDLVDTDAGGYPFFWAYRQRTARDWFLSDDYCLGSFNWICDQLGLEADALRRQLLRRQTAPPAENSRMVL